MRRLVAYILLVAAFSGTYQQSTQDVLNSKILSIFGRGPTTSTETSLQQRLKDIFGDTESKANCVCVEYYHCSDNQTLLTDGRKIIDIRADEDGPPERPCKDKLDWCCTPANVTPHVIDPVDVKRDSCGWRNADGVGFRSIGDLHSEAQFGEFPWMVAIQYTDAYDTVPVYQCGGSLIHPRAVVTAAHCVANREKKYQIRAGEWDTRTTKETYPHQDRGVQSAIVHPDFYSGGLFNDIAFLLLDSPLNLTFPNIATTCLPPQGTTIPGGTRCFATGWGQKVFDEEGQKQAILKKLDLPMVNSDTCQTNLRKIRRQSDFELDKSFVCAGGEPGKDTCKGDGGSPLVCPIPGTKGRYQQVGIVSWGVGCGDNQIPGVYSNVALFRDWIDEKAKANNLDLSAYAY